MYKPKFRFIRKTGKIIWSWILEENNTATWPLNPPKIVDSCFFSSRIQEHDILVFFQTFIFDFTLGSSISDSYVD